MDNVVCMSELHREELFGLSYGRTVRENDAVRIFHIFEDTKSLDLFAVLEKTFFGTHLVRKDRDTVFLDDLGSEVCDGLCGDDDALTLL